MRRRDPQSRNVPVEADETALLIIDVQNYSVCVTGGAYTHTTDPEGDNAYFFTTLRGTVLPNLVGLRSACRQAGVEVIYTVIESQTVDGRDRSLDYRLSGIHVLKYTHAPLSSHKNYIYNSYLILCPQGLS